MAPPIQFGKTWINCENRLTTSVAQPLAALATQAVLAILARKANYCSSCFGRLTTSVIFALTITGIPRNDIVPSLSRLKSSGDHPVVHLQLRLARARAILKVRLI